MDSLKATILIIIGTILLGFIFGLIFSLYSVKGQTVGIGVSPAKVSLPAGLYDKEFCFFNQGDTNVTYKVISGDVRIDETEFLVPAGTDINNCIKKTIRIYVEKTGYFYVRAILPQNTTISIVRQVGIKVECLNCWTTTTTQKSQPSSSSGASSGYSKNQTNQTISEATIQNTTTTTTIQKNISTTTSMPTTTLPLESQESQEAKTSSKDGINYIILIIIIVAMAYLVYQAFS